MTPSHKSHNHNVTRESPPVSKRAAVVTGAVLLVVAAIAIVSAVRSPDPSNRSATPVTSTTKVPDPALIKLDQDLTNAVNLSVAFAGSVQVLDRELRAGSLPGSELSRRATAFEDQVTQTKSTVEQLVVPEQAQLVKEYAVESMQLYLISTRLLKGVSGAADTGRSGLAVRVKLIADRVFDRARVELDVLTNGELSSSGQRALISPPIPDFAVEAPGTGANPGVAPAKEKSLSIDEWRKRLLTQRRELASVIDGVDWTSSTDSDASSAELQASLSKHTDALAIRVNELTLTESGRAMRLASAVFELAAVSRSLAASEQTIALVETGQRIWALAAKNSGVPSAMGSSPLHR